MDNSIIRNSLYYNYPKSGNPGLFDGPENNSVLPFPARRSAHNYPIPS